MEFNLSFPTEGGQTHPLQLQSGEKLFVLGANGTGKSSLMFHFNTQNYPHARKVSAHRQTLILSSVVDLTASRKLRAERNIQNEDQNKQSRYRDRFAAERASIAIFELVDAENRRARAMASAYDEGDMEKQASEANVESPIAAINELLRESDIPIEVFIRDNDQVMASKNGGPEYGVAQLSDGERNVLLIAANVLTAPRESLFLIDEPERHLHRSIIAPLLGALFERRKDCGFVISTHDVDLALERGGTRSLLLRSCTFKGQDEIAWVADELGAGIPADDHLKRDLLGSRRSVLFVEGTETSIDKTLYSVIFPMVSIVPKGSCTDVERAVAGSRAAEDVHWLRAYGIVDGDGLDAGQLKAKREHGVYGLPFYSAEAVYYHPVVIERIASRQASTLGMDKDVLMLSAMKAGVSAIRFANHTERLSEKAAKKAIRKAIFEQMPNDDELLEGNVLSIQNHAKDILTRRRCELDAAVEEDDWEQILRLCSVKESSSLSQISSKLRFANQGDYLAAVRHLVAEDSEARSAVRALFGNLTNEMT